MDATVLQTNTNNRNKFQYKASAKQMLCQKREPLEQVDTNAIVQRTEQNCPCGWKMIFAVGSSLGYNIRYYTN